MYRDEVETTIFTVSCTTKNSNDEYKPERLIERVFSVSLATMATPPPLRSMSVQHCKSRRCRMALDGCRVIGSDPSLCYREYIDTQFNDSVTNEGHLIHHGSGVNAPDPKLFPTTRPGVLLRRTSKLLELLAWSCNPATWKHFTGPTMFNYDDFYSTRALNIMNKRW